MSTTGTEVFLELIAARLSQCVLVPCGRDRRSITASWPSADQKPGDWSASCFCTQYRRRADLMPNLVRVVQGAANFEKGALLAVVDACAKVESMQVDASTIDEPQKFKQIEHAQDQLSSALSRLLVVPEQYPEPKTAAALRDPHVQLEGTENRIAVARRRYIDAVVEYKKPYFDSRPASALACVGRRSRRNAAARHTSVDGWFAFLVFGGTHFLCCVVPRSVQRKAVNDRVRLLFIELGITETRDRSGALILLSVLEQRIDILDDRGIREHMGARKWQDLVESFTQLAHSGSAASGLSLVLTRLEHEPSALSVAQR